jgi:hypothetical protein
MMPDRYEEAARKALPCDHTNPRDQGRHCFKMPVGDVQNPHSAICWRCDQTIAEIFATLRPAVAQAIREECERVERERNAYYEGILFAVIDAVKDVPTYEGTKPNRLDFLQSVRRAAEGYANREREVGEPVAWVCERNHPWSAGEENDDMICEACGGTLRAAYLAPEEEATNP